MQKEIIQYILSRIFEVLRIKEKRKEFFNYVDKNYKATNEEVEEVEGDSIVETSDAMARYVSAIKQASK